MRRHPNKFKGVRCSDCRVSLPYETHIYWDKYGQRGKKVFCVACGESRIARGHTTTPAPLNTAAATDTTKTPETIEPEDLTPMSTMPAATTSTDLAATIAQAIAPFVQGQLDEKRVLELIEKHAPKHDGPHVQSIEIIDYANNVVKDLGRQHKQFPELLQIAQARDAKGSRINLWVHGMPGDGKTTACENIAKALSLPFCTLATMATSIMFFGYRTAGNGEYVTLSDARKIWEHGGVLILDDFDGTMADTAIELNAPFANGYCQFPDGMVPRHPDCLIILTANTRGEGATADMVGRAKQDKAFLDRFVAYHWEIDEDLERATCGNEQWALRVQAVRRRVKDKGIKILITPRASFQGAALLGTGMAQSRVEGIVLGGKMTPEQWAGVR